LRIDLNECTLSDGDGFQRQFEVEPFLRRMLLEGLDNISLSLQHTDQISAWEKAHGLPPAVSG
jgi:3-isopropylmalate/(R)-2-methylmalate dehydratase small subunit